jgi:DNA polymerase kappa
MTDNSRDGDGKMMILPRNPYAKAKTQSTTREAVSTTSNNVPATNASDDPPAAAGAGASALVIAAADKAGMEGIDRNRIDQIILRESGTSLFIQQQRRRDAKVDERIAALRTRLQEHEKMEIGWNQKLCHEMDQEIPKILSQRPVRSAAVVVDMDMFYMACELLTRPDLAEKPACVGKGMILTSNYLARRYGVRSAMAGWIGDKLVEELSDGKEKLMHVSSNFALYNEKSMVVRKVLAEYDPHLRAYSLDEAYMDLGPYLALRLTKGWDHDQIREALIASASSETDEKENDNDNDNENEHSGQVGGCELDQEDQSATWSRSQLILASYTPAECLRATSEIVKEMRQRVCDETGGLTCSAGVAPNFMLAKIASDRNKPDGQLLIGSDHEAVVNFLHPLATRKVSGIGRVTEKTLNAFGVQTVRDLYEQRALVRFLFQPASAKFLLRASLGCSSSDDKAPSEEETHGQKGISRERTFQSGRSWAEINSKLEDIGRLLSKDMVQKKLWGHTITIKVKLHTFDCLSRARTLPRGKFLQGADDMVTVATDILREIRKEFKGGDGGGQFNVRLLGIRCSNFQGDEERTDASQMNIEKFLESKPQAVQSPPARCDDPLILLPDCPEEQSFRSPAAAGTNRYTKKTPPASKSTKRTLTPAAILPTVTPAGTSEPIPCVATATAATTATATTSDTDGAAETVSVTETETVTPVDELLVHCPVCQSALFSASDNDGLNRHVDACLNGGMVRRAAQEESLTAAAAAAAAANENGRGRSGPSSSSSSSSLSPSSKRQRWSDFFGPRS